MVTRIISIKGINVLMYTIEGYRGYIVHATTIYLLQHCIVEGLCILTVLGGYI